MEISDERRIEVMQEYSEELVALLGKYADQFGAMESAFYMLITSCTVLGGLHDVIGEGRLVMLVLEATKRGMAHGKDMRDKFEL